MFREKAVRITSIDNVSSTNDIKMLLFSKENQNKWRVFIYEVGQPTQNVYYRSGGRQYSRKYSLTQLFIVFKKTINLVFMKLLHI
jgi:hypothetical protein